MTVAIALLGEGLGAVGAGEGLHGVVSAHVILDIAHLAEHFQANFALSALVLPSGFFIEHHHRAPEFFLANHIAARCLFFTKQGGTAHTFDWRCPCHRDFSYAPWARLASALASWICADLWAHLVGKQ